MITITIPESINAKEKLVAIPHEIYEKFLRWQKIISFKTFEPTMRDKKVLSESRVDYVKGRTINLNELKQKLGYKNQG